MDASSMSSQQWSCDWMDINTGWHHLFTCCLEFIGTTAVCCNSLLMATDIEHLASFEEAHYDQYEYYNLVEYSCHARGKGRTKKEIELNTNRHCPAGHERKIAEKYHNTEINRKTPKIATCWNVYRYDTICQYCNVVVLENSWTSYVLQKTISLNNIPLLTVLKH